MSTSQSPPQNPIEKRLADLEAKVSGSVLFERLVKSLTLFGAVCGFGWGLYQSYHNQQMEFRKAFWEKQYALYTKATRAAAEIADAASLDSVKTQRTEFWSLYWGELSIVETLAVEMAMVRFGKNLSELESDKDSDNDLKRLSYRLARACRKSLKTTWEPVALDDIPERVDQTN